MNNKEAKKEVQEGKAKGDWGTYKRLLSYVRPYWLHLLLCAVGILLAASGEAYFARLFGELIGDWATTTSALGWTSIPLMMLGAALLRAVGTIFGEALISRVSFHVVYNIRQALFSHILRLPSSYFDANTQGHIVSRVTFTVAQLRDAGTDALKTIIQDGIKVIVFLGGLLWLNWEVTLLFLATAPLLAMVVAFASNRFRRISRRIQNSMGDVTHFVSETVSGYRVVRTFGGENYEEDRFDRSSRTNRQQNLKMAITKVSSSQLNETIVAAALCGIIILLKGAEVSVEDAVTFLSLAGLLGRPIRKLSEVNAKLQRGLAAAEDVFAQLDEPIESDLGEHELANVSGQIEFKGVNFSYTGDKRVLRDINIRIEAGQTIAVVGKSGSGKSTLVSLLPRFYDITSGQITIDGHDIKELKLGSLRHHIALVSQDVTLFNDTLRNNIAYGDLADRSDADIQKAVAQAHADEFVSEMSEGMNTLVGDDGVLLSGGQRQRVAIARALLKDAPILILDEATSALDTESERHIQAALAAVMKGRTTIVIAHRLSTIEAADVILVMQDGRIIESGDHHSLVSANGNYAELHHAQFKEEVVNKSPIAKKVNKPPVISLPNSEAFEKSALGLSKAWYQGAWWLHGLRPLSWLFDILRRRRMRRLASQKPGRTSLPVIVVGNITVGGTGKTPLVVWLVEQLRLMGFSPGVVLRGYGGALSKEGTLIPTEADPERYSDEGVQLRDRLNCPMAMCADRVKGLRILETQDCDIAISDDGLQHYAMARDVEICVIDGARGVGNGMLLPAGPLREPVSRLQEVDWVVANGEPSNLVDNESIMRMKADGFWSLDEETMMSVDEFLERHPQVHAVCGIGNPARFFSTLRGLGVNVVQHVYRDHHEFSGTEVKFDDNVAVVCTEKDAAKLKSLDIDLENVWFLRVSVDLPEEALARLQGLLAQRAIAPRRVEERS
jgi:subfamily B ATP-binding cassette protein MsbA